MSKPIDDMDAAELREALAVAARPQSPRRTVRERGGEVVNLSHQILGVSLCRISSGEWIVFVDFDGAKRGTRCAWSYGGFKTKREAMPFYRKAREAVGSFAAQLRFGALAHSIVSEVVQPWPASPTDTRTPRAPDADP